MNTFDGMSLLTHQTITNVNVGRLKSDYVYKNVYSEDSPKNDCYSNDIT